MFYICLFLFLHAICFNSRLINASCSCSDDLADRKTISYGKKCLRRSLRLASTQPECGRLCPITSSQKLESPGEGNLGAVLRNKSSLHLVSCHKNSIKRTVPLKHCHVDCFGEKDLRKSPRINPSTRERGSGACIKNLDVKLLNGSTFRRSLRLLSSTANEKLKLVLQEKETSKVIHRKKKSLKANCASVKLSNSSNKQHSKATTTSGETSPTPSILDANCLRLFSESTTSPSDNVNGKTNCHFFDLPESDENPPRKKFKTSASLTNESKNHSSIPSFIGDPIPDDEAQKIWGWRYELKVIDLVLLI